MDMWITYRATRQDQRANVAFECVAVFDDELAAYRFANSVPGGGVKVSPYERGKPIEWVYGNLTTNHPSRGVPGR